MSSKLLRMASQKQKEGLALQVARSCFERGVEGPAKQSKHQEHPQLKLHLGNSAPFLVAAFSSQRLKAWLKISAVRRGYVQALVRSTTSLALFAPTL